MLMSHDSWRTRSTVDGEISANKHVNKLLTRGKICPIEPDLLNDIPTRAAIKRIRIQIRI